MAVVKNLLVRAGADFSGMKKEMQKAQSDLKTFKMGMNKTIKLIGAGLATLGIGKVIKDSVSAASELEGALLGLQSILEGQGKSFGRANEFIQSYIKDGLVPLQDAVSAYKNLAARGYDDEQIKNVMERLKDAAAFGRQSSYTLGAAVATATEGLKNENSVLVDNAGVTKNVSKMWQDYAKSIGKNTNQLTMHEKIQAEVNGIMEETRFQVGDAAKYTETFAGRLAALNKTMYDVKVNLGNAFMPIANTILPLLQSMANHLSRVTSYVSEFMQALFGKNAKQQTKSTVTQAIAIEELGDAYDEAGKKAKGSIAGFDEVNTLADGSGGGSSDIGSVSALAANAGIGENPFAEFGESLSEVSVKAREMSEKVKASFGEMSDFITDHKEIIIAALAGLAAAFAGAFVAGKWTTIVTGLKAAFAGLAAAIAAISWPVLAIAAGIGALTGAFIYFYRTNEAFSGFVEGILQKIGEAAKWLWTDIMIPFGKWLVGVYVRAWEAVSSAGQWYYKNVLIPLGDVLLTIWKKAVLPLSKVLTDQLGIAFTTVGGIAASFRDNVLIPLKDSIADALIPTVEALTTVFDFLWKNVMKPYAAFLSDVLIVVFMELSNVILKLWNEVLKPLATYVGGYFLSTFQNVFTSIGGVIDGLKTAFIGLMNFITGVFTADWGKAWNGVRDIFKGVFDGLYSIVKFPLNQIIDAVNTVIRGLNKISIDIPDIPGVPGRGTTFGINIPQIPKLAKGGITNGPMLAMIGDNPGGREVVSPLDDLKDMIASAVATAMLATGQMNQQGRDGDVIFQVDGTTFARVIKPFIQREDKRIGGSLIVQPN